MFEGLFTPDAGKILVSPVPKSPLPARVLGHVTLRQERTDIMSKQGVDIVMDTANASAACTKKPKRESANGDARSPCPIDQDAERLAAWRRSFLRSLLLPECGSCALKSFPQHPISTDVD